MIKGLKSRFVEIACSRCGRKHIIFGKSSTRIKCLNCNKLLVETKGGKIRIRTIVKAVLR